MDSWPQKPEVLRTPWPCPSRSFKAPGLGVGLTPQLRPASPHRAHTWSPRGWAGSALSSLPQASRLGARSAPRPAPHWLSPWVGEVGEQGLP